jgi:DNA topoisomerase I
MAIKLVIVESPAKAKTLTKILGKNYVIRASMGHVRDLPEDSLGINVEEGFEPVYRNLPQRKTTIKEIKDLADSASAIFLATDPDREGEAISWHLVQAAKLEKGKKPLNRVTFHEITKEAVEEAFNNPRAIDMKMVDAQQARRVLDRLVGYKLSPLLWKKVLKGLSAGRVQSAAVRLVVDREREILSFQAVEYWTIEAELVQREKKNGSFRAQFVGLDKGKKLNIPDKQHCDDLVADLKVSEYKVNAIDKKEVSRQPAPPFITSTLQQEAVRKLHYTAKKAMVIAQQLYEGLPIGEEGDTGLITYMRTDSTHMAATAIDEIRDYIKAAFSDKHLPAAPRQFSKKVKMAQEAHEAIRPTRAHREPAQIKKYLNKDQFALYELIWKRAVASQMSAALFDTITVDINAASTATKKSYLLQSKASSLRFPGFMGLYIEGKDEEKDEVDEEKNVIPQLSLHELLKLIQLYPEQIFTQPPARYTEATLIKALEQKGIGRPSTYAPIISTVQDRGYVYKDGGKLRPEEIGMIVNDLLVSSFPNIVDFNFTAKMENELDEIAKGKMKWMSVIKSFYGPFEKDLVNAQTNLQKIIIKSEEKCPECGQPMVMKSSRFGKFLACSNYPECKGKKSLNAVKDTGKTAGDQAGATESEAPEEKCPECGKTMIVKAGRFGKFYACPDYPKCKGKKAMGRKTWSKSAKPGEGSSATEASEEKCPECGSPMVLKYGRFGKFLACSKYPECKTTKKIYKYQKSDANKDDDSGKGDE